jgi:hypothetical protein
MPDQENRESRERPEEFRKKVWEPKFRTGCITCRWVLLQIPRQGATIEPECPMMDSLLTHSSIRRVTCDEAKPNCKRYTSTRRNCDGYVAPDAPNCAKDSISSTRPSGSSFTPVLFLASKTSAERHSLAFFHQYTAPEMAGFFDSNF